VQLPLNSYGYLDKTLNNQLFLPAAWSVGDFEQAANELRRAEVDKKNQPEHLEILQTP